MWLLFLPVCIVMVLNRKLVLEAEEAEDVQ